nr:ribonuclease H-like domain, reverse transcriptase, RNA-dependent DNA polymerase [Tanacetum cinerariifolium]
KQVIRYIKGTKEHGIIYKKEGGCKITGYSDSSYGINTNQRKGTTGIVFYFGESLITWCTQKQPIVELSSCELEFMAATGAACQALWLKRLLSELTGWEEKRITLKVDNISAIALVREPVFHGRSKHIDIRYHFIRECVENGHINVEHVSGELQRAYILTKALPRLNRSHHYSDPFNGLDMRKSFDETKEDEIENQVIAVETVNKDDNTEEYNINFLMPPQEGGESEITFFERFDEELNKVNTFYRDKVEEVIEEVASLNKQMIALIALRIKVKQPSDTSKSHSYRNVSYDSSSTGSPKVNSPSRIDPSDSNVNDDRTNNHGQGKFYSPFNSVVYSNRANSSKYETDPLDILDRVAERRAASSYMKTADDSYIGSCDEGTELNHYDEFLIGTGLAVLTLGTFMGNVYMKVDTKYIELVPLGLLISMAPDYNYNFFLDDEPYAKEVYVPEHTMYVEDVFPIYSLYAYIILYVLMYAANIYFWRRYRNNYPFIFGFKQGTELNHYDEFLIGTGLAVLTLGTFMGNVYMKVDTKYIELVPLGLLISMAPDYNYNFFLDDEPYAKEVYVPYAGSPAEMTKMQLIK